MNFIGLSYPIEKGTDGYFSKTSDTFSNERARLLVLLNTYEGERFMQPSFGFNLYKFVFENSTPSDLEAKIRSDLYNKISFWIPNLNIDDMNVSFDTDSNTVNIQLSFSLVSDASQNDSITFSENLGN